MKFCDDCYEGLCANDKQLMSGLEGHVVGPCDCPVVRLVPSIRTRFERYLEECEELLLHNAGLSLGDLADWEHEDIETNYLAHIRVDLVVGWILSGRGISA